MPSKMTSLLGQKSPARRRRSTALAAPLCSTSKERSPAPAPIDWPSIPLGRSIAFDRIDAVSAATGGQMKPEGLI